MQVSIGWRLKLILAPINCRDFKLIITIIFRSFLIFVYLTAPGPSKDHVRSLVVAFKLLVEACEI